MTASSIFCAIDTPDPMMAAALVQHLDGVVGGIKLGLEFVTAHGPQGVRQVMAGTALPLFLDLKFHDIPNTMAGAVASAVPLAPAFLTVHTAAGPAALRASADAAADAARRHGLPRPKLLGVTVLTSLDESDLERVGQHTPAAEQVERLALLAMEAGLDGIVCSPQEVARLRTRLGPSPILMVPGIRTEAQAGSDDQRRTLTPAAAKAAGATYLVVGRPITRAPDPAAAARALNAAMAGVE